MEAVAITGVGVLSGCGCGCGAEALAEGIVRTAVGERRAQESSAAAGASPIRLAGVEDRELTAVLAGERSRHLNRETALLLAASLLALRDAGVDEQALRRAGERSGVAVATRDAGLADYVELFAAGVVEGPRAVRPARGPRTGLNAPAAHLSIRLGASGPNATFSNGSAGGVDALDYACSTLRHGAADTMIVGGVEAIGGGVEGIGGNVEGIGGGVGTPRPRSPHRALARPFDRRRSGAVAGEAAVALVLERAEFAAARGARVRGWPSAIASGFSPEDDLRAAARQAIDSTLAVSGAEPVAVLAGANGSVEGDAAEADALWRALGERTPVGSLQGALGDCGGAAALAQLAAAALALERRALPPTVGLRERGEDIAPIQLARSPVALREGPILLSSWDESCCAASLLVWSERPRPPRARTSPKAVADAG